MRAWCVLLTAASLGCGVRFGDGGGSSSGGGSGGSAATDAAADAIVGLACGRDAVTHAELCSGVSACPGLVVDPDAFPGCGFVPGALDLSCLCNDVLCPMGKPKTCADAKALLASSNVLLVCSQASDGPICKSVAK